MKEYKIIKYLFIIFLVVLSSCNIKKRLQEKPVITQVDKPAELLWQDANKFFRKQNYAEAASTFEEIDKQHPYSKLAKTSQIMAAYTYYYSKEYKSSIVSINRFIALYPADKKIPYMLYLRGLCYFDQISSVDLDQEPTEKAGQTYSELIKRFPDSKYSKDAKNKMLVINNRLAAKEMDIGRYYQKKDRHIAAIERFKKVVEEFQTTSQTPEALYRLTESYLSLGIIKEAKKTTAILGHNYKTSYWYQMSFSLLQKYGYNKKNDKQG